MFSLFLILTETHTNFWEGEEFGSIYALKHFELTDYGEVLKDPRLDPY